MTDKRLGEAEFYKNIIEATASKVLSIDSTMNADIHPESGKAQAQMYEYFFFFIFPQCNRTALLEKLKITNVSCLNLPKPSNSNTNELTILLGSLPPPSVLEQFNIQISSVRSLHESVQIQPIGPIIVGFN